MKKILAIMAICIVILSADTHNEREKKIYEYRLKAFYHLGNKEYEMALYYDVKACELGSGMECANVGSMYANGNLGHQKNYTLALQYYVKACKLSNGYGCTAAAILYENGLGVKKDSLAMLNLYIEGCNYKDKVACDYLEELSKYTK